MATKIHVLSARITSQIASFVRGMDQAVKATVKLRAAWTTAGAAIGAASVKVGLAAGLVGGLAIKKFAQFESQIIRVGAVTETLGGTDGKFEQLKQAALTAGETTVFSATQSAEAIEKLGLAGLTTEEIIGGALAGSLQLAAAAQIDIATAADISAKTMRAFGLEASELSRINDTLIATTSRSNTNMLQLAEAMKPVAPIAAQQGVSLEKTAAILAKMADSGFQGSVAGVALRRSFINLAGTTPALVKSLKRVGIESIDPLFVKLEKIKAALDGAANETEALQIAAEFFGARAAAPMIAALAGGVGALEEFSQELVDAGGLAQTISDAQLDSLGGQFQILKSIIEGVTIAAGEEMNPQFRSLIALLQENVSAAKDFFVQMGQLVARFVELIVLHPKVAAFFLLFGVAKLLGITSAIFKLSIAIGTTLTTSITVLQGAFVAMGLSATAAWAAATLGISLLVVGIIALIANFGKVKDFFTDSESRMGKFVASVKSGFMKVADIVKSAVMPIFNTLRDFFVDDLLPVFEEVGSEIITAFADVWTNDVMPVINDLILPMFKAMVSMFNALLIPALKVLLTIIKVQVVVALKSFGFVIKTFVLLPLKAWAAALEVVMDGLRALGLLESKEEAARKKQHAEGTKRRAELIKQAKAEKLAIDEAISGSFAKQIDRKKKEEAAKKAAEKEAAKGGEAVSAAKPAPQVTSEFADKLAALNASLDSGAISLDQFREARENLDRSEERQGLLDSVAKLQQKFAEGKINAEQYTTKLQDLKVSFQELRLEQTQAAAKQREEAIKEAESRRQLLANESQRFIELKNTLGAFGETSDKAFGIFTARFNNLADALRNGSITQDQFRASIAKLNEETQKAIALEEQARRQRIVEAQMTGGQLSEADQAFLRQQIQAERQAFLTQRVNNGFNSLIKNLSGMNEQTEETTKRLEEFGDEATGRGRGGAFGGGGGQNAQGQQILNQFLNSVQGAITTAMNNISLLRQILTLQSIAGRRRRQIQEQIAGLLTQIRDLLRQPPPQFIASRTGFQGLLDPGLQREDQGGGGGSLSIVINTPATSGTELIREIELELQRRGRRI